MLLLGNITPLFEYRGVIGIKNIDIITGVSGLKIIKEEKYHKNTKINNDLSAYFTVEASIIIPITLICITIMIFLCFYSYDRCIMEMSAYEASLRGGHQHIRTNEKAQGISQLAAGSLINGKLFAINDFNYSSTASADKITVSYNCNVSMPLIAWVNEFVSDADFSIEVRRESARLKQTDMIRLFRSVNNGK